MQTTLRRMGNSTGLIVPRRLLDALGADTGSRVDLSIEGGKLVAAPVIAEPRQGWAAAAADLGKSTADEADWLGVPSDGDADLRW